MRLSPALTLMRWHSPTGAFLLFAPCAWGLALAGASTKWYALFAVGAWFMRSFGCILNDWADRNLDALVPRTHQRPLASGELTFYDAFLWGSICLMVGVCVWMCLPPIAQWWSLGGLALVCLYPWSKRFFFAPQLLLGITFNIGAVIAYVTITGQCDEHILWLWASAAWWTVAYDTVYAFHDAPYDKEQGFYSTAHMAQKHPYLFVGGCLLLHVILLIKILPGYILMIYGISALGLLTQWKPLEATSSFRFFRLNRYLSIISWILLVIYKKL